MRQEPVFATSVSARIFLTRLLRLTIALLLVASAFAELPPSLPFEIRSGRIGRAPLDRRHVTAVGSRDQFPWTVSPDGRVGDSQLSHSFIPADSSSALVRGRGHPWDA